MTTFRELKGTRVISRASAETLGKVADLTFDLGSGRVAALLIGKGRKAHALRWEQVHGVGPDAVVAETDEALTEPGEELSPLGHPTLSELGNALGPITDVEFEGETGRLVSVTTTSGTVAADRLLVVGPYATIIAAREDAEVPG